MQITLKITISRYGKQIDRSIDEQKNKPTNKNRKKQKKQKQKQNRNKQNRNKTRETQK